MDTRQARLLADLAAVHLGFLELRCHRLDLRWPRLKSAGAGNCSDP